MLTLILLNQDDAQGKPTTFRVRGDGPGIIGRRSEDVQLADSRVSKQHAEISRQNGRWVIRDLGSANGTWVNGQRITTLCELEEGDQLKIGRLTLIVGHAGQSESAEIISASPTAGADQDIVEPDDRGARELSAESDAADGAESMPAVDREDRDEESQDGYAAAVAPSLPLIDESADTPIAGVEDSDSAGWGSDDESSYAIQAELLDEDEEPPAGVESEAASLETEASGESGLPSDPELAQVESTPRPAPPAVSKHPRPDAPPTPPASRPSLADGPAFDEGDDNLDWLQSDQPPPLPPPTPPASPPAFASSKAVDDRGEGEAVPQADASLMEKADAETAPVTDLPAESADDSDPDLEQILLSGSSLGHLLTEGVAEAEEPQFSDEPEASAERDQASPPTPKPSAQVHDDFETFDLDDDLPQEQLPPLPVRPSTRVPDLSSEHSPSAQSTDGKPQASASRARSKPPAPPTGPIRPPQAAAEDDQELVTPHEQVELFRRRSALASWWKRAAALLLIGGVAGGGWALVQTFSDDQDITGRNNSPTPSSVNPDSTASADVSVPGPRSTKASPSAENTATSDSASTNTRATRPAGRSLPPTPVGRPIPSPTTPAVSATTDPPPAATNPRHNSASPDNDDDRDANDAAANVRRVNGDPLGQAPQLARSPNPTLPPVDHTPAQTTPVAPPTPPAVRTGTVPGPSAAKIDPALPLIDTDPASPSARNTAEASADGIPADPTATLPSTTRPLNQERDPVDDGVSADSTNDGVTADTPESIPAVSRTESASNPPPTVNPRRVAYLVDASGSMVDAMDQGVLTWLAREINQLEADTRYAVIFFREGEALAPAAEAGPPESGYYTPASDLARRGSAWFAPQSGNIQPYGRSEPTAALSRLAELRPEVLYILSNDRFDDRGPGQSSMSLADLRDRLPDETVTVHTVQFFYRSPDDTRLQDLAQQTGGTYRYIDEPLVEVRPNLDLLVP